VGFGGASENSRDDERFEPEGVDDAVGRFIGAEFATGEFVAAEFDTAEFAAGSVGGVSATAAAAAEEFWAVSCDGGVADFLLRKRVAAPRRVATITTIMAAMFQ
jgi:hypothetical protein